MLVPENVFNRLVSSGMVLKLIWLMVSVLRIGVEQFHKQEQVK